MLKPTPPEVVQAVIAREKEKRATNAPPRTKKILLDCISLGEFLTIHEIKRLKLELTRQYRWCKKDHGPQCACEHPQRCGSMCGDYVSAQTVAQGDTE
jgi:hypothetical protein